MDMDQVHTESQYCGHDANMDKLLNMDLENKKKFNIVDMSSVWTLKLLTEECGMMLF
jgi:hypothetical protein